MDINMMEPTLNIIKGMCIMDNDGNRILAKYYDKNILPTVKEQKAFEKNLFNKTHRSNTDIIMLDGLTCVYKSNVDLFFYVMGTAYENELILMSVLNCLFDSICLILKKNVEKRTVMENLEIIMLTFDEICDGGIILDADPSSVIKRVDLRNDDIPIGEQTVAQMLGCLRPRNDQIIQSRRIEQELQKMNKEFKNAIKILLLGTAESGKTTVIKQMKILHINGFSNKERMEKISEIQWNIFDAIFVLVKEMNLSNLDFESNSCSKSSNYILQLTDKPNHDIFSNSIYKDHVLNLWSNQNVRNFFKYRSNELHLSDSAKYFLDNFERIAMPNYMPSTEDILHSRKITTGIHQIQFKVKIPKNMGGGFQEFRMFDVGGQRDQRNKWIQVFEGIQAVLFLISCGDFDQVLREDRTQNRLVEALTLFDRVWHNRFLSTAGIIVFLNKQDVMERKIQAGKRIGDYFPEYEEFRKSPGKNGNFFDECDWTKNFIKHKLIEITEQPSRRPSRFGLDNIPRQCYYHFTVATDTNNIRKVFTDVHSMILSENLASVGLL